LRHNLKAGRARNVIKVQEARLTAHSSRYPGARSSAPCRWGPSTTDEPRCWWPTRTLRKRCAARLARLLVRLAYYRSLDPAPAQCSGRRAGTAGCEMTRPWRW